MKKVHNEGGGAMVEALMLIIGLLFFGLVTVTIIAIALIITLVVVLSENKKTHL